MASSKRSRRSAAATPGSDPVPASPSIPAARAVLPPWLTLSAAALAVFASLASLRWAATAPWSYDEYYHLALARAFPLRSFSWTPLSLFADAFADKEPLFHLLLAPFAGWSLERAAAGGVLLGQAVLVATMAFALRRLQAPRPWLFLLALPGLGTLLVGRTEMLRPHIWLIAFTVATLAALATRAPIWSLALLAATFGLVHTGGWIAVPLALLGALLSPREGAPARAGATWAPTLAAAVGWLAGQLAHPNLPNNFRLAWIQNAVVPWQSAGGDKALRSQLGAELLPPPAPLLADQWPVFVLAAVLVIAVALDRTLLRSRPVLLFALPGLASIAVGSLVMQRFFELGAPLVLLALAAAGAERERSGKSLARSFSALLAATVFLLVAGLSTRSALIAVGYGRVSGPEAMARFLGGAAKPGERVFTAQWADSAPLLYHAPQAESLVALDPTFFWIKDRSRFAAYVRIVEGSTEDPAAAIRRDFGARWVTVWKMPAYERLARQLAASAGAKVAFDDRNYMVFDLAGVPAS